MTISATIPEQVFSAYRRLGMPVSIEPITLGLINKTYLVATTKMQFVLQEVAPIFDVTVNEDSEAVSNHLVRYGIVVPRIFRTVDDKLFTMSAGKIFRALTYIAGKSSHTIVSSAMATSAGRVLGEFHRALLDFSYDYRSKRRHGGDYGFHRENLVLALKKHSAHDFFSRVEPFAEVLLKEIDRATTGLRITPRNVHGDPKISNIIFDDRDDAICLVDFDTLGNAGWSLEMGDALRSWANPHKEDVIECGVDLSIAECALRGYGDVMKRFMTPDEALSMVTHAQAISLCLSMRYLTDVLNENYWAYDCERYSRPAEHNLIRAKAMHHLFQEFFAKQGVLTEMVSDFLLQPSP